MARPIKTGLDYFPLDVYMDEKIELIEAKHGLTGFGLIIKLYQIIYTNGYYFNVTDEKVLVIKKRVNVSINEINDIISDSCRWNIFNEKLFKKYSILTSCGIQKRFIEATKRRTEISFVKEYLLVKDVFSMYKDDVNVYINSINDNKSTQRKVKKSIIVEIVDYLNLKTGSKYRPTTKNTVQHISARLNENFNLEDFKTVIDFKTKEWSKNPDMMNYLRPETLFGTKFESYLNARQEPKKTIVVHHDLPTE